MKIIAALQELPPDEARTIARRPTSTASRWWTATASSTPTSSTARPRIQGAVELDPQHRPRLHARRQGNSDAQLGHALLASSAWTSAPSRWCSPCRRSRRSATSRIQFIDAYTFNFAYIGSRATGNGGGSFLIAGPSWKGKTPEGVKTVIRSETELASRPIARSSSTRPTSRTSKKVQAGYKVQPLSAVPRQAGAACRADDRFRQAAHAPTQQRTSPEFFNVLNFVSAVLPDGPVRDGADGAVRQDRRRARQGVRPGRAVARDQGRRRGGNGRRLGGLRRSSRNGIDTRKVTSGDLFGTREPT